MPTGGAGGAGGADVRAKMLQVSRGHICDLLSFCVRSHTFRMKYFVLRNNVVRYVCARAARARLCGCV